MDKENSTGISLMHYLSISKGKLVWTSSFEALQSFVEEALNLSEGNWSSPGGYAKLYEDGDIALRWYSNTKSITLSGKLAKQFEEKLYSMASISQDLTTEVLPSVDSTHNDAAKEIQPAKSDREHFLENSFKRLESRLLKLSEEFIANTLAINNTLCNHSKQLDGLINQDESKLSELIRENHELKVENNALEERINNLSYILADLQGKAKHAEEEKASLVTAIRLLNNSNLPNHRVGNRADDTSDIEQENQSQTDENLQPNCTVRNSFAVLNVEDTSPDVNEPSTSKDAKLYQGNQEINVPTSKQQGSQSEQPRKRREKQTKEPNSKPAKNPKNRSNEQTALDDSIPPKSPTREGYSKSKTTGGYITILGDSMIKMIKPQKLSRSIGEKVNIKTFPGATIEDMHHYIQPTMKKQPKLVVIHVGTNDIQRKEPEEIVAEMESLCKGIVAQSLTKIAISEIIKRQDTAINTKIERTNALLAKLCSKFKWQYIQHTNIDSTKLNASGLHLNALGTAMLAKNFVEFFKN